jgi:hypothetical protein
MWRCLGALWQVAVRRAQAEKSVLRVARMLHGVAASFWEPLKQKDNCCDNTQHAALDLPGPGERFELPTNGLRTSDARLPV